MKPTLQGLVARAKRNGRSTITLSVTKVEYFLEVERTLERLADQTGITESDPRLQKWM